MIPNMNGIFLYCQPFTEILDNTKYFSNVPRTVLPVYKDNQQKNENFICVHKLSYLEAQFL